jgi:hypothetical protein
MSAIGGKADIGHPSISEDFSCNQMDACGCLLQIQVCNSIIAHDAEGAGPEVRRTDDQLERGWQPILS